MYEFHYDYMKRKYKDEDLKLCYMDTDSLIYSIRTEDFCAEKADDIEARFDASGYVPDRPLPVGKNKKVIGLMKDELGGEITREFVSLRSKMYSYKVGNSEPKKCKGIKHCVVKRTISFEDYKKCLFSGEQSHRSQLLFRSRKHEVRTLEVNKLALSREDDKKISTNGVASYARGHYRVWGCESKNNPLYKMVVLTIETFKIDNITAISVDDKNSGEFNYKSVKFAYDGGEVSPIRIDGDFRLFRFRNKNSDTYSLSITCDPTNESFFRELNEVIAKESCKINSLNQKISN